MRIETFDDGYAICGDCTSFDLKERVVALVGKAPLIASDPPYGKILPADWDHEIESEDEFVEWMINWTSNWQPALLPNAAFYVWGGVGGPGFRPFFKYIDDVESGEFIANMTLANLITWSKKRAYGVKHNYLFTREELAYFINGVDIKKPRCFNIPLLDTKRGYAGYNAKYPAKSEFYRRTNVWMDVTEIMQGKVHAAQKAQRVIEIPIEVHTQPGEYVIDLFAGSGTTAFTARKLGRRFVVIEKDEEIFDRMVHRLHATHELDNGSMVVSNHGNDAEAIKDPWNSNEPT